MDTRQRACSTPRPASLLEALLGISKYPTIPSQTSPPRIPRPRTLLEALLSISKYPAIPSQTSPPPTPQPGSLLEALLGISKYPAIPSQISPPPTPQPGSLLEALLGISKYPAIPSQTSPPRTTRPRTLLEALLGISKYPTIPSQTSPPRDYQRAFSPLVPRKETEPQHLTSSSATEAAPLERQADLVLLDQPQSVVQSRRASHAYISPSVLLNTPFESRADAIANLFDRLITNETIYYTCQTLFADGHYAIAVEKAFVCVHNAVKEKSGVTDKHGAKLMSSVFNASSPVLKLNQLRSESDRSEQDGYMHLYIGATTGIRNPRAHEYEFLDSPEVALELLVFANHLMRKLADTHTFPHDAIQE